MKELKLQKYKSVDGVIFKENDPIFSISEYRGVVEGKFLKGNIYSKDLLFHNKETATLFLRGRTIIEGVINKDYKTCECNCEHGGEYGCKGRWENKPYKSLYYNPTHSYNSKEISDNLLKEAKENIKAIEVYEKYKKKFDVEKWEYWDQKNNF